MVEQNHTAEAAASLFAIGLRTVFKTQIEFESRKQSSEKNGEVATITYCPSLKRNVFLNNT
ncbi:MAG: hypothetical protein LBG48_00445 [Rickettsiales bacterium]|jgi:hypothetical protein|nr:hypothetical protein [Rickettsiales bacterium]